MDFCWRFGFGSGRPMHATNKSNAWYTFGHKMTETRSDTNTLNFTLSVWCTTARVRGARCCRGTYQRTQADLSLSLSQSFSFLFSIFCWKFEKLQNTHCSSLVSRCAHGVWESCVECGVRDDDDSNDDGVNEFEFVHTFHIRRNSYS